jgi:hypothetical protein
VLAAASIVGYGVAIDFAVDSILQGLLASRLIAPADLAGWRVNAVGVKSPVYLCAAIFWIYITGTAGLLKMAGVVAALMRVYAPIALVLLTATAVWMLPGAAGYRPDRVVKIAGEFTGSELRSIQQPAWQIILGFFAMASLSSVDWGVEARSRRDLVLGGLTGVALAAFWTASLSLVVVAGASAGALGETGPVAVTAVEPRPLSFRWAVVHGIGGIPAGVILILFGLAALAPACYAVQAFGETLSTRWPRLRHWGWTWIGGAVALVLGATSSLNRLDLVWRALGDAFAPALGAIAGDWLWHRGHWPGTQDRISPAGVAAWALGLLITLALESAHAASAPLAFWAPPASVCGFLTSFALFCLLTGPVAKHAAVAMREPTRRPLNADVGSHAGSEES